jgi:hypothetical protein
VTEPTTLSELAERVDRRVDDDGRAWLAATREEVAADPTRIRGRFPAVGRAVGRGPLDPDVADDEDFFAWTVDDAARTLLLAELGSHLDDELADLYRHGDAAEKRAVLRALPVLDVGDRGVAFVDDALRANDLRLIAAAMGPYAIANLDDHALAHAVLKCVFVELPLDGIEGLEERTTPELSRMLGAYVHERVAAGRSVPADVWPLIDRFPPEQELAAVQAETEHPVEDRRRAAEAALADRAAARTS